MMTPRDDYDPQRWLWRDDPAPPQSAGALGPVLARGQTLRRRRAAMRAAGAVGTLALVGAVVAVPLALNGPGGRGGRGDQLRVAADPTRDAWPSTTMSPPPVRPSPTGTRVTGTHVTPGTAPPLSASPTPTAARTSSQPVPTSPAASASPLPTSSPSALALPMKYVDENGQSRTYPTAFGCYYQRDPATSPFPGLTMTVQDVHAVDREVFGTVVLTNTTSAVIHFTEELDFADDVMYGGGGSQVTGTGTLGDSDMAARSLVPGASFRATHRLWAYSCATNGQGPRPLPAGRYTVSFSAVIYDAAELREMRVNGLAVVLS